MIIIGENLKRLRKRDEITQEQLAEALGLTAQAVSRWENGISLPDITLLPSLANYFDVTVDELLGVEIQRKQQQIEEIMQHNNRLNCEGRVEESISYLREKIRLYPNSAELLYQLIVVLYKSGCEHRDNAIIKEVVELCDRAVFLDKGSTWITACCKQWLCFCYNMLGQHERAVQIAQSAPTVWVSKEVLLPKVLDLDTERVQREHNLLTFMDVLVINLHHLSAMRNSPEESIELLQKAVQLIELIAGDDPKFYNERLFKCHLRIARCHCVMNDTVAAFNSLYTALEHAVRYESRPQRSNYSPYWLCDIEDNKGSVWRDSEQNLFQFMQKKLNGDEFSLLHGSEDYNKLLSDIETYVI